MAKRQSTNGSSCNVSLPKSTTSSDVQLYVRNMPFAFDKELLATKSARIAALLEENSHEKLSYFLHDMPADAETFELVGRFCHGFEIQISTENSVPLICLAYYLGMTENHSNNNLLDKAITFFEERVVPSWNETIKALRTTENLLQQAAQLRLVDACLESLIEKALVDPRLLGEPVKNLGYEDDSEDNDNDYGRNARRKLFVLDWKSEDLSTLSLQLYEPTIRQMCKRGVPSEYIAASICQYMKKWVFPSNNGGDGNALYKRNSQREVIEAMERVLPHQTGLLPCTLLFEILRYAISMEASFECRNGFEIRIGKQLDEATVKDLLIPSQGYAKELQYDIECVKRILKIFYSNYTSSNISGLIKVAELVEEFLAEVATDIDLRTETFVAVAEMSMAASLGTQRNSDGIYRGIDIYLDKHMHLTELEREEVCMVLDCQKLSPEACEHAAKNERLPLRVVVQVLFVAHLQLRDVIVNEVSGSDDKLSLKELEEDKEESETKVGFCEEEVRVEMEQMNKKVMELERECCLIKKEIENGCRSHGVKKGKVSMWREVKRKFGCMTSIHDCNCQVKKKKVHPKYGGV